MAITWQPRQPQRVGAERREAEQAAVSEMTEHGRKCPQCGSKKYVPQGGCWICLDCAYSPCK